SRPSPATLLPFAGSGGPWTWLRKHAVALLTHLPDLLELGQRQPEVSELLHRLTALGRVDLPQPPHGCQGDAVTIPEGLHVAPLEPAPVPPTARQRRTSFLPEGQLAAEYPL